MRTVIECVPNFSTSDSKTVESILSEIRHTSEIVLLDSTFDDYYDRLVVSFVGNKRSVLEAAMNASLKAVELIDMNSHKGQHPRIGAVDVVPFIPVRNATMEECVEIAKEFGKTFAEKSSVPVYLYGHAAASHERKDLDWIRRGEYEELSAMIRKPGREPDFGSARVHPTAGATITGARKIMAGLNVNLSTDNLSTAKRIAKALHGKKGGLSNVKAMAVSVPEQTLTQVGMSITDFDKTPLYRVLELLKLEAARYGVSIVGSEFCGMAPLKAIVDIAKYYLKIDNLSEDQILEIAIQSAHDKSET